MENHSFFLLILIRNVASWRETQKSKFQEVLFAFGKCLSNKFSGTFSGKRQ